MYTASQTMAKNTGSPPPVVAEAEVEAAARRWKRSRCSREVSSTSSVNTPALTKTARAPTQVPSRSASETASAPVQKEAPMKAAVSGELIVQAK